MKALVGAFNQEKALVGAFSVITNLRMELFQALVSTPVCIVSTAPHASVSPQCVPVCGCASVRVRLGRVRVRLVSCPPSCTGPATTLAIRSATQGYVYSSSTGAGTPHTALTPAMVCSAVFCAGSAEPANTASTCQHLLAPAHSEM